MRHLTSIFVFSFPFEVTTKKGRKSNHIHVINQRLVESLATGCFITNTSLYLKIHNIIFNSHCFEFYILQEED